MTSVREASFDLFRAHGMTTMFGNPGLDRAADAARTSPTTSATSSGSRRRSWSGWPTATRRRAGGPALVNLHTAPGVGNAMGAIFNAQANHTPLVDHGGPADPGADRRCRRNLTNRDATRMPHPLVKWSYEPPRAAGRAARARPRHPPRDAAAEGPGVRLDPDGRLGARRSTTPTSPQAVERTVDGRAAPEPDAVAALARRLGRLRAARCSSPAPTSTRAAPGSAAVALAERQHLPVWASPPTGGGRLGFPEGHRELPRHPAAGDRPGRRDARGPRPGARRRRLGLPLLPEHPRRAAARGRVSWSQITCDPDEAARAPMGDAIVADVRLTLEQLVAEVGESDREPRRAAARADRRPESDPISGHRRDARARGRLPRRRDRRRSSRRRSTSALRNQLRISRRAATTSPPAAASASASRRRSACSSRSPTARSSA